MTTRRNLVTNPSFEVNTTGWSVDGGTLTNPTSGGFVGVRSMRSTANAGGAYAVITYSPSIPVAAGSPFAVSAYFRGTPGNTVNLRATWVGATGSVLNGAVIASLSTYQRIVLTGVAPAGATAFTLDWHFLAALIGDFEEIDAVLVEIDTSTAGTYFDGSSSGGAWTGTPNASTSTWDVVTTYHFTGAVAYDRLGSSWRTAAGLRSVTVTDPNTGLLPTGLTQGGLAVTWLTADANSRYSFSCDVPGVVVDFGAGAEALYANEVPGLAIVAGAATDTAVATLMGAPTSATRVASDVVMDGKIAVQHTADNSTFARVFNPRAYGAIGDGTTDDTAAIQAALNAGAGQTVAIPPGTFLFTTLTLTSGVTLRGAGGVLKLKNNTCANAGSIYYVIENLAALPNVSVIDLMVDGNMANNTLFLSADMIVLMGENQRVQGCTVVNSPNTAIMLSGCTNSVCRDNRLSGGTDCGIYVNDSSGVGTSFHETVIEGNRITGLGASGIALKRISSRCIVSNNTIYSCGYGITLEHGAAGTDYSTNITIIGNRIRDTAGTGIMMQQSDSVICIGNRLENHKMRGVYGSGLIDSVISGNVIDYATSGADASYGNGIMIEDEARASTRVSVVGNVVRNAKRHGIGLTSSASYPATNITIVGNTVTDAENAALYASQYNTGLIVEGNTFGGKVSASGYDYQIIAGATMWCANNSLLSGLNVGLFQQQVSSNAGWTRGGSSVTGSRPSATTAGVGASIYDSTLSKPVYSDGTNWHTAVDAQVTHDFTLGGTLVVAAGTKRVYNDTGRTLTFVAVRASVVIAPTGAAAIFDVTKNGTTIYTTQANRPSIAISGTTALGGTPDLTWAPGEYLTLDCDQIGSTIAGADATLTVTAQ